MASKKKNAGRAGYGDLCEVLLNYLQRIGCVLPGGDSITIEDVLNLYDSAMGRRQVPNREKLLHRHPDLAEHIKSFFAPIAREVKVEPLD